MSRKDSNRLNVSIVIPNYNGEKLLSNNLPKVIKAFNNTKNKVKEIIIVDDASTDSSVKVIKSEFPEVKLIKHKINRGFAPAVNTGARASKGELIALLNSDVLPSKNFLESIIPHFNNENVFAVSMHEKDYSWARGYFKDGYIVHEPGPKSQKAHDTFWVSGGSGVFRRKLWMKLGGMDEVLFKFYWEDVDLGYRATKRGYSLLWEPKAEVIHKHESSTSARFARRRLQRMQERNQLLFIWKNLTSPMLFRKHTSGLIKRMSKNPGYLRVVISTLPYLKKVIKARKKELKECKVSDEAIFAKY